MDKDIVSRMHLIYAGCPICGGDCNYIPGVPDDSGWKWIHAWECMSCHKRFDRPDFAVIPHISGKVTVKDGRVIGGD